MADIRFNCPSCNQSLEAEPDMAGQLIDCPSCNQPLEVPFPKRTSSPAQAVSGSSLAPPVTSRSPTRSSAQDRPAGSITFTVDGVALCAIPQRDQKGKTMSWEITADSRPMLQLVAQGKKMTSSFKGATGYHELKAWFESGMKSFSFRPSGEQGISILVDGNPVDNTRERPAGFMSQARFGFWFVFALFTIKVVVSVFRESMADRAVGLVLYGAPMIALLILGTRFHQKTRTKLVTALVLGILELLDYGGGLVMSWTQPGASTVSNSAAIWVLMRCWALGDLIKGLKGTRGTEAIPSEVH